MKGFSQRHMAFATLLALALAGCGKDDPKPTPNTERDLTPNGLGEVCRDDTDCQNGLSCWLDTADPTGYQLCTTSCSSGTECHTKFAEYTTCTGALVCVVTCESDEDCVDGTICDSHGWCQRGGPDSGVKACVGTVASCSSVETQSACEAARCNWGGACKGTPPDCSTLTSEETCAALEGCEWFSSTSSCSGDAFACVHYLSTEACALQTGCSWESSCVGVSAIATCEAAGLTFCATTPGCSLVTQ